MKCDVSIRNRIKRAHGQMQGVLTMIEQENTCVDIVTQLKAIRSSIDKAIGILTTSNLIQVIEDRNSIKLDNISDALSLVVKSIN